MAISGWIKLHRKLLESDMYKNLNLIQRDVMMACLLMANHESREWIWKGQVYKCNPGEFVTSLEKLSENCANGVTIKGIRVAIEKLQKWGFLASKGASTGRIITICKWDTYQSENEDKGKRKGKRGANEGQAEGQLTRSKEDKEVKEDIYKSDLKFIEGELAELTPEQRQRWDSFLVKFADQEFTELVKIKNQLTPKQLTALLYKYNFSSQEILFTLGAIDNCNNCHTKYTSVYRTVLNWIVRERKKQTA